MNNFYALIYLTEHLKNNFSDAEFLFSYSPYKDVWEAYFDLKHHIKRVIFSTNSSETAIFSDQDRPHKKSNVTTFFDSLNGDKINNITLADNDRILTIHFKSDTELVFQLFGNKPNIFLVKGNKIIESFKANQTFSGKKKPEPRVPNPNKKRPDENASAKQVITRLFPKFPRHLIQIVADQYNLEEKSLNEKEQIVTQLIDSMLKNPEFRVLEDGNLCLIPEQQLHIPTQKNFDNINDAIRYIYYETSRERRLSAKIRGLKPKIEQAIHKNETTIQQLMHAEKGLDRASEYEQFGHLLMAHAHEKLDYDKEVVELANFYDNGKPVTIPVKQSLSFAENAQRYYDKSSKAIRNVEESKRRLSEIKKVNDRLYPLLESLSQIKKVYEFDDWYDLNEKDLKDLGILSKSQQTEALPFRKVLIDSYEVWIGKSAKSNDHVTAESHKEDVWLHARGVSGSHVVIRMNNNKEMPPKSMIQKAAAVAAWNSKARGSKLAPVIFTKRKYVTRPKGAVPGAVKVQKEQVEMVQPQKLPS